MRKLSQHLFLSVLLLLSSGAAHAVLQIEITEGVEGAFPIAIVPFGLEGGNGQLPSVIMSNVISSDLARTGRFKPFAERDLVARPTQQADVQFHNWRILGADYLVVGKMRSTGPGTYAIQFQLFDVFKQTQLAGYSIPARQEDLRYVAHQISDIIYETLTGEPGAANTRIAYLTVVRSEVGKSRYSLYVADADGYNPQVVMQSNLEILSPSWSPDGRYLAYVSFENTKKYAHGEAAVFIHELATGKRQEIAKYPGHNGAPAWSPDGTTLALVISRLHEGDRSNYDIFLFDLQNRNLKRVTTDPGIDTYPVFSPNGKFLLFTSDRSGRPQIYRKDLNGGREERITFTGAENDRAVISPDGKKVGMVTNDGGNYRIAVLDLETRHLQVLTDGALDESPSFAPNGSMIIYATTYNNRQVLSAVSTDGRVKQRIPSDEGSVREPAWSPFVKK